jgi:hypothetical protein
MQFRHDPALLTRASPRCTRGASILVPRLEGNDGQETVAR